MKFSAGLVQASLVALAASASINLNKRATPLDVKLEMVGNSEVKATVTNNGDSDLNLYTRNSFLDEAPIEKAEVHSADSRVAFDGIRYRTNTKNLTSDAFMSIPAKGSIEVTWDAGEMHDLSSGGDFDILTQGAIPYAEGNSTDIVGAVPYSSNKIKASINGKHAAKVRRNFLDKIEKIKARATLSDSNGCSGDKGTKTKTAMTNCQKLALKASEAAASGNSAAFTTFFKQASGTEVAATLKKVADECGSTTSGATYYCDESSVPSQYAVGGCQSQVLAYTMPSQSLVVNCDLYYSALPALASSCYDQDQATTTLHEFTHLTEVKGTDDLGYGYSAATQLTGQQALNNADSYALFANAVNLNCGSDGSSSGSSSSGSSGSGTSTGSGTSGGSTPVSTPTLGGFPGSSTPSAGSGSGTGTSGGFPGSSTPGAGSGTGTIGGFPGSSTPGAGSGTLGGFPGSSTPISIGGLGGFGGSSSGDSSSSGSSSSGSSSSGFGSWPPQWLTEWMNSASKNFKFGGTSE